MTLAAGTVVRLFLDGKNVGSAVVRGHDHGWYFGDFSPGAGFAEFAPLFGQWSLLMHAEDDREKLSEAAHEELRRAEIAMDRVRARVLVEGAGQWHSVREINIDGDLIEWWEA